MPKLCPGKLVQVAEAAVMAGWIATAFLVGGCGNGPTQASGASAGSRGGEPSGGEPSSGAAAGASPDSGGGRAGAGAEPSPTSLDLNDVSFLFPLPKWADRDDLLSPSSSGARGELLPASAFDVDAQHIVVQQSDVVAPSDVHASLRVVGIRVDPCFPADATATPACRHQIRMVLQPIVQDSATSELTTMDSTVHLFFDLTDTDWSSLVRDLHSLRGLVPSALRTKHALGINPTMALQGLRGEYATALRSTMMKYAGNSDLSRVALAMLLTSNASHTTQGGMLWTFTAFDRKEGRFQSAAIPLMNDPLNKQDAILGFTTSDQGPNAPHHLGVATSVPETSLQALADDLPLSSDAELHVALRLALELENPTSRFNPQTDDCVSCHFATRNRGYAEAERGMSTEGWPERFEDPNFSLDRVDAEPNDIRVLRSFGYFGIQSAVAQRTINESAVVAAALSR